MHQQVCRPNSIAGSCEIDYSHGLRRVRVCPNRICRSGKGNQPEIGELTTGVLAFEKIATSAHILASVGAVCILAVALNPPNALPAALTLGYGIALATGVAYCAVPSELGSSASGFDVIRASESLSTQTVKFFDHERPDLKGIVSTLLHMLGDGLRSVRDQQT